MIDSLELLRRDTIDVRVIAIITIICLIMLVASCAHVPEASFNLKQALGKQKTFDYQGLKINYYAAGQGPPIILLHGYGGCAYSWRFLVPALAQDHRVYTIDLKGFGLSDKPEDGKYAMSDQADMVAAFIRSKDLRHLVIMGHSMGGGVTLMTYLKVRGDEPARVKSLVLIDSAGYPQKMPWFIWLPKTPVLGAVGGKLVPSRMATAQVLRKCYYDKAKITEEQIDTYAYYGSLPGAREAIVQTARQIEPPDIGALVSQYETISVPVLIIWGAEDEVVPLSLGKRFKRDIPNSQLVVIPQCGHMPPEEQPGKTTRTIEAFLKK
jgi:pimeloyl-ACP methyl ester carboxylesterase